MVLPPTWGSHPASHGGQKIRWWNLWNFFRRSRRSVLDETRAYDCGEEWVHLLPVGRVSDSPAAAFFPFSNLDKKSTEGGGQCGDISTAVRSCPANKYRCFPQAAPSKRHCPVRSHFLFPASTLGCPPSACRETLWHAHRPKRVNMSCGTCIMSASLSLWSEQGRYDVE